MHIFCHTLDTIPINWYLERELCHGIAEWDVLRESFLSTLSFEDGFKIIDEAMQEIKAAIFIMLKEPIEWTQPDWCTKLCHVLECYNVIGEVEEDDP